MSTDAIVLLKNDHKEVRALFRDFQKPGKTPSQKGKIVDRILELLTVHTYIENEVLSAGAGAVARPGRRRVGVLRRAPRRDVLSLELSALKPGDERFDAKTTVLMESVTHHMDEEEQDWFPKVRDGLGRKRLQEIGALLMEAKKTAPRAPQQPSALKKAVDSVLA